ncbi:unnamed protein product [Victoria cruziana]
MERDEAERKEKDGFRLTLMHNGVIVTMDEGSRVYSNGAIVVEGDRIRAVGRSPEIFDRFSPLATRWSISKGELSFLGSSILTSTPLSSSREESPTTSTS